MNKVRRVRGAKNLSVYLESVGCPMSESLIYTLMRRQEIPFIKPSERILLFDLDAIDKWIDKKGMYSILDKLISEGIDLKSQVRSEMGVKMVSGVVFEEWASKCVLYLEINHPESSLTEKAVMASKSKDHNNSGDVFEFLLGTLKAFKVFEASE